MRHPLAVFSIVGLLWASAPGSAAEPPRTAPELAPCKEPGMPPGTRCGTYEVFENRAARTGRKIPLRVVVVPASGPGRLPDPIAYFAGGPGEASIPIGLFKAEVFGLPEVKVASSDLERLSGTYESEEMGMALKVDLQGDGLFISVLRGGPPFPPARLIPTSPTRFRWEGDGMAPGLAVLFQVEEGKAATLSVVQPNKPADVVLKRSESARQGLLFVVPAVLLVLVILLYYRGTAATRNGRAVTGLARG